MKESLFYWGLILSFLCVLCSPVAATEPAVGDELLIQGLFKEAIAAYEEELKTTNDPAPVYNNLAAAHYQDGNIAQARHYFQLAAEAAPANGMPWINLGMLSELEGDLGAAKANYLRATSSAEPAIAANGHINVAMVLLQEEDIQGAINALNAALAKIEAETAPEYQELRTEIYDQIGYIYASIGDNEAAFDAFAAATQTGTKSPIPWLYLGAFLETAGMNDQALLMYQEAITRDVDNVTLAQEAYDTLRAQSS